MNVVVNGLMTNYQKIGSGKTVIFLHGWGDSSQTFSKLAEELQAEYEVLALDLPGISNTQAPASAWSLENYAEFVGAWLQKVGISKVYAVIGHSNGAAISMHAVAKGLLKPQKLVLLAASGIRTDKKIKRRLLKAVSKTGKIITSPLPNRTRAKIRSRFYSRIGSEVGLFPHMEETFRKIISYDTQQDAGLINIPTLLMYGDKDKTTPVAYGKKFHSLIKNSRLEVVNAGHFLHHEKPEEVAAAIKTFLKEPDA